MFILAKELVCKLAITPERFTLTRLRAKIGLKRMTQQLISQNTIISKEGKYPKERGKSPARARARAHKERGHKEKNSKSAHKHLFFKHRQETQAA